MTRASHDGTDVSEILTLLHTEIALTAVTLQWLGPSGCARITIRKVVQDREWPTQQRYSWEARGGTGRHAWGGAEGPAYDSAVAAYQAAVDEVQSV